MKPRLRNVLICLILAALVGKSQDATPAQAAPAPAPSAAQAPQPSATLAPPREISSTVNTGSGFSIEPMYWMTKSYPVLRGGSLNFKVDPGNLDYPSTPNRAIGARLNIPAGKNATVRGSYFQTQSTGFTVAPTDLNLFGTLITKKDLLATRYKIEAFKLSYDYLTYFWKKKNSEVRLKTLWEVQRISITNEIDEFVPRTDTSGTTTFSLNTAVGSKSILYPTFGLGLEQTLSRHFRWEARGSGFGLPHRGEIADAEADVAIRIGHFEVLAGGRYLRFKTTPKAEQYNSGAIYGPVFSARYYWKKQ